MNPKRFTAIILKKLFFYDIPRQDAGDIIGVSYTTWKRRIKNPEEFTLKEADILVKKLKFTDEERREAFL